MQKRRNYGFRPSAFIMITLDIFYINFHEIKDFLWPYGNNFLYYDISEKACLKEWYSIFTGARKWLFLRHLYFYFERLWNYCSLHVMLIYQLQHPFPSPANFQWTVAEVIFRQDFWHFISFETVKSVKWQLWNIELL